MGDLVIAALLSSTVAALAALGGVFGGRVLDARLERKRWEREKERRFETHRLDSYVVFLEACSALRLLNVPEVVEIGE
jgi:hypothetical protein